MSEFVFVKTFNFGEAALFLITPWCTMALLLGYERARAQDRNIATGRGRGHRAHVEDIDRRYGQKECAEGTGRRHGQRTRVEDMEESIDRGRG